MTHEVLAVMTHRGRCCNRSTSDQSESWFPSRFNSCRPIGRDTSSGVLQGQRRVKINMKHMHGACALQTFQGCYRLLHGHSKCYSRWLVPWFSNQRPLNPMMHLICIMTLDLRRTGTVWSKSCQKKFSSCRVKSNNYNHHDTSWMSLLALILR